MPGPPGLKGHRVSIYLMLLCPIFKILTYIFLPLYFAVFFHCIKYSGLCFSILIFFPALNAFRDMLEFLARRVKMELWDQR